MMRNRPVALRRSDGMLFHIPRNPGHVTIGRDTSSDIVVSDPGRRVSNQHCLLEARRDHSVWLCDCSTNGTWVNGLRCREPFMLTGGDSFRLPDSTSFDVLDGDDVRQHRAHRIKDTSGLDHYVRFELQRDLEAIEERWNTEKTLQSKITGLLDERLDGAVFRWSCEDMLATGEKPDIIVRHGHGITAFELKRAGTLDGLLADAEKLKGYLRAKRRTGVRFGVLAYCSPRPLPDRLRRATQHQQLVLIRVRPPR